MTFPFRGSVAALLPAWRRPGMAAGLGGLFALLVLAAQAAASPLPDDSVRVERVGPAVKTTLPGAVVTALFRLASAGVSPRRVHTQLVLPEGWTAVTPAQVLELPGGATKARLVSFRVPERAEPGRYPVRYTAASEGDTARALITAEVPPVRKLALSLLEAPAYAERGASYTAAFLLVNEGNVRLRPRLQIESSYDLPASADTAGLSLAPRQSLRLPVTVRVPGDQTAQRQHRLRVHAAPAQDAAASVHASSATRILPPAGRAGQDPWRRLPARFTLRTAGRGGTRGTQVALAAAEQLSDTRSIELLLRTPGLHGASLYGDRDRYRLTYTTRRLDLRLGDHAYRLTPLTEFGRTGFGAEGRWTQGRWTAGAFAHRSRYSFLSHSEAAGYLRYRPTERLRLSANYLYKTGRINGQMASVRGTATPLEGTEVDAEYSIGARRGERGDAYRMQVEARRSWGNVTALHLRAGANYPGDARNRALYAASIHLAPRSWLHLNGQYRREQGGFFIGNPDPGSDPLEVDLSTYSRYARLGGGVSNTLWGGTGSARLQYRDRSYRRSEAFFGGSASLDGLDHREQALSLQLRYRHGPVSVNGEVEGGRVRGSAFDDAFGGARPLRAYSLGGRFRRGRQSYSASLRYRRGSSLFSLNEGEQWSLSLGAHTALDDGLHLAVRLYGSRLQGPLARSYGQASTRLDYTFPFGHVLTVEARQQALGTRFGRDGFEYAAAYTLPLGLPVGRNENRLEGRVYSTETGEGIEGVLLHVRAAAVRTGEDGSFSLVLPEEAGTYYLGLDRSSLGLNRTPTRDVPIPVRFGGDGAPPPVEIGVARSARVQGRAVRFRTPSSPSVGRDTVEVGGVGGAVLELSQQDGPRRRVASNAAGRFSFTDLPPGTWTLRVVDSALPSGYAFEQKRRVLDLRAGQHAQVRLRAFPRRRRVRIIEEGTLQIQEAPGRPQTPSDDAGAAAAVCEGPAARHYTVERGDWLSTIAQDFYAAARFWPKLWLANRGFISDPDLIFPGQRLCVPPKAPLTKEEAQALTAYRYARKRQ